ncbi:MAG: O-antigen ligase family protein [Clostridia bacterium]|nr:O-antigen ligase family protein [Clostridia bacterium]MBQ4274774.1 O-antigen ligase family protein [Clostridia bacterium]
MKKILLFWGYVVILTQQFSVSMPLFDVVLGGYTIKYLLYYFFIATAIGVWAMQIFLAKKIALFDLPVILLIVMPIFVGLLYGWAWYDVIVEGFAFLMPLAVYAWCRVLKPDLNTCINIFCFTNIVGAIVSFLVATRVIETKYWAEAGNLVRAAGAVDSTMCIGGFCLCLLLLSYGRRSFSRRRIVLVMTTLFASLFSSLLGQSRTRIVILFACVVAVILLSVYDLRMKNVFAIVLLLAMVGVVLMVVFRAQMNVLLLQIGERFAQLSGNNEDINVAFRDYEAQKQLEFFASNPIFGMGWGSRSTQSEMYVHNVYTALMMQTGIIGLISYICWVFRPVRHALTDFFHHQRRVETLIIVFFSAILLILGFTNAGAVTAGGYFMLAIVFVSHENLIQKERVS